MLRDTPGVKVIPKKIVTYVTDVSMPCVVGSLMIQDINYVTYGITEYVRIQMLFVLEYFIYRMLRPHRKGTTMTC